MESILSAWTRYVSHPLECGNKQCRQSKRFPFRCKRRGVWLRGSWFCSDTCMQSEIERVVERFLFKEHSPALASHRMPLGLLMLSRGFVNAEQLRTALRAQRQRQNDKIGHWLQHLGYVTERQVVASLALQWATPVLAFPAEALPESTVPWEFWKALRIMPVRFAPTKHLLYVAFSDPVDHGVLRAIEHMTGWSTSACVVSDQAMNRLLSKVRPSDKDSTHTFENVVEPAEMARIVASYAGRLSATEVKLTECGPYIWVRLHADRKDSDLVFRVQSQPLLNTLPLSVAHSTAPLVH